MAILEAIISSSKIALLLSHGCVHLFVSWVLGKAQGTQGGKAFSEDLQWRQKRNVPTNRSNIYDRYLQGLPFVMYSNFDNPILLELSEKN